MYATIATIIIGVFILAIVITSLTSKNTQAKIRNLFGAGEKADKTNRVNCPKCNNQRFYVEKIGFASPALETINKFPRYNTRCYRCSNLLFVH